MIKNIAHVIAGVVQNIFVSESVPDSNEIDVYVEYSNENAATIGGGYNAEANVFIGPKPFPSWTLNEESFKWESPDGPMPTDGVYRWDEISTSWIKIV